MNEGLSTWLLQQNLQGVLPTGTTSVPQLGTAMSPSGTGLSQLLTDMNLGDWMTGIAGLGNLALGFNQYGLAKDILGSQLGMAEEQWQYTKEELDRLRNTRDRLNSSYMGSYGQASGTPYPAA